MLDEKLKSEIQHDPKEKVPSIRVVPLESEKMIMRLKPNRKAIFHGDCRLICIEGGGDIFSPADTALDIIDNEDNEHNEIKQYDVEGVIFGIKSREKGVKFSIQRPQRWK